MSIIFSTVLIGLIWLIWFLVFNATFSSISAISWRPVLVVEEDGVPGENHRPWAVFFCVQWFNGRDTSSCQFYWYWCIVYHHFLDCIFIIIFGGKSRQTMNWLVKTLAWIRCLVSLNTKKTYKFWWKLRSYFSTGTKVECSWTANWIPTVLILIIGLIWFDFDFWCLTPLSAVFQLFHGDQF
jgi:hypothetical protein